MKSVSITQNFSDLFRFPTWGKGAWYVWRRNFLYFRYSIWISLLWAFIEPLLYLFAFGYGLGQFIGTVDGKPYIEFFFPGLMLGSAMMVAFYEGAYGCFTKLARQNTFETILHTPVMASEIALGEILWASSKGMLSALAIAFVAVTQGLVDPQLLPSVLVVTLLISLIFGAFAVLMASMAKNYDWFIYAQTGFIIPMYLFSGTFFPFSTLPEALKTVGLALPLTHGVMAVRSILGEAWDQMTLINLGVLLVFTVLLINWAVARFERRLIV